MRDKQFYEVYEQIKYTTGCYDDNARSCAEILLNDLGYRKPEWISVKDRLPENDEPVLVYKGRCNDAYANMETAYFDYGRWMGVVGENVTHWMPLPSPPTEKEN